MPWLLSPTNAIDDLKIGLYESSMYVIAGVTEHVGSVAAKELLAKKKPVKVIVRDAWSKQGACYVMFPESAGFTKTQRTCN
jgi:hypothetical protein